MQVFNDSLYSFVTRELISRADAFEISPNVEELKMMIKGIDVKDFGDFVERGIVEICCSPFPPPRRAVVLRQVHAPIRVLPPRGRRASPTVKQIDLHNRELRIMSDRPLFAFVILLAVWLSADAARGQAPAGPAPVGALPEASAASSTDRFPPPPDPFTRGNAPPSRRIIRGDKTRQFRRSASTWRLGN